MPKIKPFEKHYKRYEDWFIKNKFAYKSELLAVKKMLPEKGGGIEIGVGSGKFANPLGIKWGVDPSSKMRNISQKKGIKVIDGVGEKLPFNNDKFAYALMVTTICFLDDLEKAFSEAYRVLKPNGYFIVGFVDKLSPLGKFYQEHQKKNIFYKIANFFSVNEVIYHLRKANFTSFAFAQTIFHDLAEIKKIETPKEGFGEGSFIVIRAIKDNKKRKL